MRTLYPRPVKKGDRIGIVLPSSMIDTAVAAKVSSVAQNIGVTPVFGNYTQTIIEMHTFQQSGNPSNYLEGLTGNQLDDYHRYIESGFLAGSDEGRARDINNFFADPNIKAIWCLRGGFSSSGLLSYLDYDLIKNNPKQFVGFSDITVLLNAIYSKTGLVTYHAPMLTPNFVRVDLLDQGHPDSYTKKYFDQFLLKDWSEVELSNPADYPIGMLSPGVANGVIFGGNLGSIARLAGTPYLPDPTGKILFLEEVRSHIPHCYENIIVLKNSGIFDKLSGLIIGDFTECHNRTGNDKCQDWRANNLIDLVFSGLNIPVVNGLKVGHEKQSLTIPIGSTCQIGGKYGIISVSKT